MAAKKNPTLETKTVSEARRTFSETLNRVYRGEARVTIEKNGIPVGVLVSPQELSDIEEMQRRRDELHAALEETRAAFDDVPPDELAREIDQAIKEIETGRRRRLRD
jgi:prevent-host-death family protein